jgi:hypothetical protein
MDRYPETGKGVYALLPRWPEAGRIRINDLPLEQGASILLLGTAAPIQIERDGTSVEVMLPQEFKAKAPPGELYVLKIEGVRSS